MEVCGDPMSSIRIARSQIAGWEARRALSRMLVLANPLASRRQRTAATELAMAASMRMCVHLNLALLAGAALVGVTLALNAQTAVRPDSTVPKFAGSNLPEPPQQKR